MATATVTIPPATAQIDYDDLYARWERGNWRATEIDFSQDRIDWHERMTPEQRRGALWLFTLFFHGEDTVADTLSPYIDAALRATLPELTWGHRQTFGFLEEMAGRLRKAPEDRRLLASAITLYHIMIEGGLAQAGQHMMEKMLSELDLLPGFQEGIRNVSTDEQRHIAFGVRMLADLYASDPEPMQDAIIGTFREILPMSTCVAQIPGWDLSYTRSLGYDLEDLYEEGARMSEARLRAIGLPLDDIPNFPLPLDVPPRA